jgi:Pvc16 N-terminal domain
MSNPQAIAAATATLQHLLQKEFDDGTTVTTQPPDRARGDNAGPQLNLFLYHLELNGAWRNRGMPGQAPSSETGQAPLGLNLYYLLTAYGRADNNATDHEVLGRAMRLLDDHPVLGRQEIRNASGGTDLGDQVERIRITHQPFSLEEMSKVWTAFQTNYRISTAYEVSVVLIDSLRSARAPLPVLVRGPKDDGVNVQAGSFPVLEDVRPSNGMPVARLKDVLTVRGRDLGTVPLLRFRHPRLPDPIDVAPQPGETANDLRVELPEQPKAWPAGVYTMAGVVQKAGDPEWTTNELPVMLAPRIDKIDPSPAAHANLRLTLTVSPEVLPEQRATLLLGNRQVLAEPHAAPAGALSFKVTNAIAGKFVVRLRVDGVDSLPIDPTVRPPQFSQILEIT